MKMGRGERGELLAESLDLNAINVLIPVLKHFGLLLVLVLSVLPARLSAFGGNSPYGRLDAYIKLEQLGEGSYATVFKGFSNLTKQVQCMPTSILLR